MTCELGWPTNADAASARHPALPGPRRTRPRCPARPRPCTCDRRSVDSHAGRPLRSRPAPCPRGAPLRLPPLPIQLLVLDGLVAPPSVGRRAVCPCVCPKHYASGRTVTSGSPLRPLPPTRPPGLPPQTPDRTVRSLAVLPTACSSILPCRTGMPAGRPRSSLTSVLGRP